MSPLFPGETNPERIRNLWDKTIAEDEELQNVLHDFASPLRRLSWHKRCLLLLSSWLESASEWLEGKALK